MLDVFKAVKANNRMVMDTISQKQTNGIPTAIVHIMQHDYIERLAGVKKGEYAKKPDPVYIKSQMNIGVNFLDQYIASNPLTMGEKGYEHSSLGATTGLDKVFCDNILINSPESVVEHMERFEFPRLRKVIADFDEKKRIKEIINEESRIQKMLGNDIVKTGFDYISFPQLFYGTYGYINYFMAYALYPEIIEKHFCLQADYCLLNNGAAVCAVKEAGLPELFRLDHDIADSRGTLVSINSLDKIWLPHLARCLKPVLKSNIKMIWHCDGNLTKMLPRLLDIGIKGFQGFQYEDGMDYKKICAMKAKDGDDLVIWAGVSVTKTLPFRKPKDVKKEIMFLVENGPKTGLILGASSSVAPGVPWENIETMIEGFRYYREHGRD